MAVHPSSAHHGMKWHPITPDYLGQLIQFWLPDEGWQYKADPQNSRMPDKQAEGAARAFNLISEHGVALIADEVGMGKTIQSLAIAAALWQQKPSARILVLTPREVVADNWVAEYSAFIRQHVRTDDGVLRWYGEPVKPAVKVANLFELVERVEEQWPRLLIGKVTSFSGLMQGKRWKERLRAWGREDLVATWDAEEDYGEVNRRMAQLVRDRLMAQGGDRPPFDLVIIDEAHYLRNVDGLSLRAETAKRFFGQGDARPMADGVLLLTATPNHSSNDDVRNVMRYFDPNPGDSQTILERLCIRRLRRLGEKGWNKYQYRAESADLTEFQGNPLAESFFGAYQLLLARKVATEQARKGHRGGVSGMIRYLEGVEFLPHEEGESLLESPDDRRHEGQDFNTGDDAEILRDLVGKHLAIFKESPQHPKYEALLRQLHPETASEQKALVFVRRIASVNEITRRLMAESDASFLRELKLEGRALADWSRERFTQEVKFGGEIEEEVESVEPGREEDANDDLIPDSMVLSWFKIKKSETPSTTPASNFRQLFASSKSGVFALFFSPPADFQEAEYDELVVWRAERNQKKLKRYFHSAVEHRFKKLDATERKWIEAYRSDAEWRDLRESDTVESGLPTIWTLVVSAMKEENPEDEALKRYRSMSIPMKEALARFVEKGVLLASADVVWMFQLYREHGSDGVEGYKAFCRAFRAGFRHRRIWGQIRDSILHFPTLASKVFELSSDELTFSYNWEDSFRHARPCYPFRGGVGSKHALKCFNTPFFPDVLVSTSVLQEGVNLQYFCKRVIHYGAAWTAGDNEQRIGRIDRMFSLVERELNAAKGSAELDVRYPVLKGTVDEEHVGRFVKKKREAERLIDKGAVALTESDSFTHDSGWDNWQDFLNRPDRSLRAVEDPYAVDLRTFAGVTAPELPAVQPQLEGRIAALVHAFDSHPWVRQVLHLPNNAAFLLDCQLPSGRNQPVQLEFRLDPIASAITGEERCVVRLTSPLGKRADWERYKDLDADLFSVIGVRFAYDVSREPSSYWSIQAISDLTVVDADFSRFSQTELHQSLERLVQQSDAWELAATSGAADLSVSDVWEGTDGVSSQATAQLQPGKLKSYPSDWSENEGFVWKAKPAPKFQSTDVKQRAIHHFEWDYVQSYQVASGWSLLVAHPVADTDQAELEVLELHLKFREGP